jgi:hypothetical protein
MPDIVPHQQPGERIARLVAWKPTTSQSGGLIGKATICFAGGWTIAAIPVFQGAGGLSVGTPDAPLVDRDGVQLRDENNKRRYGKIVLFATPEAASAGSASCRTRSPPAASPARRRQRHERRQGLSP